MEISGEPDSSLLGQMTIAPGPFCRPEERGVVQIEPVGPIEVQDGDVFIRSGQRPDIRLVLVLLEINGVRGGDVGEDDKIRRDAVLFQDGQQFPQIGAFGPRLGPVGRRGAGRSVRSPAFNTSTASALSSPDVPCPVQLDHGAEEIVDVRLLPEKQRNPAEERGGLDRPRRGLRRPPAV